MHSDFPSFSNKGGSIIASGSYLGVVCAVKSASRTSEFSSTIGLAIGRTFELTRLPVCTRRPQD
jgi:hypothetical protein